MKRKQDNYSDTAGKRQLLAWQQEDDTGFVELTTQGMILKQSIVLKKRDVELHLPSGTDALWLAALLRAL